MVVRRDDGSALLQRLRHPDRPGRDPLGDEALDRRGGGAIPGRRAEGGHDVAAVGATVGGKGDHAGEAVLVEHGRASPAAPGARARGGHRPRRPAAAREPRARRTARPAPWPGRVAAQAMRAPRPECARGLVHVAADVGAPARERAEQLRPDARHFCRSGPGRRSSARRAPRPTRRADAPRRPPRRPGDARRAPAGRRHPSGRPRHGRGSPRTTWLWTCGSPFRLTPCVNTAATRSAGGQHDAGGTRSPGGGDGVLFQIRERPGDRLVVHGHDRARRVGTGQREEHAGRLRRAEGQVERRHGRPSRSEHDPATRMAALEQSPELVGPHGAGQAEPLRRASRPTGPVRPRAARGRDRTGSSRPCPARSRGSRAWWPPVTRRTGGVNGRPAVSSGGAPRPGSPASSPSRSRRSPAAPPPGRRRGGPAPVPR